MNWNEQLSVGDAAENALDYFMNRQMGLSGKTINLDIPTKRKWQAGIKEGYWKNKQGRLIKIAEMDNSYLLTCYAFVKRNSKVQGIKKIKELKDECRSRRLTT